MIPVELQDAATVRCQEAPSAKDGKFNARAYSGYQAFFCAANQEWDTTMVMQAQKMKSFSPS